MMLACTGLRIRVVTAADASFLSRLYVEARWSEFALVPHWTDAMRRAFLESQAHLQQLQYSKVFENLEQLVIANAKEGEDIGQVSVAHFPESIHIVDITLCSAWRNRGVGATVFRSLLKAAALEGRSVTLNVAAGNRAQHLYQRLGFQTLSISEATVHMIARPELSAFEAGSQN